MASKFEHPTAQTYLDSLNSWRSAFGEGPLGENSYPIPDPSFIKDGLVFTYSLYEITPYCDGTPQVVLTYDELKGCLKFSPN